VKDWLPSLKTRIPGPKSRALARQLRSYESRNVTYVSHDWPIFWQRASGVNVWDVDGNRYIDLTAGFGVASVGHTNPRVVAAIRSQAKQLTHAMGDVHPNELKVRLARELVELTFGRWSKSGGRVIFANSGAEAVEAALKTAAIHTKRPGVVAFEGAYHGLTYGALDATWRSDFRAPFKKQLGHFTTHVPYGQVPLVGRDRRARRGRMRWGQRTLQRPISHYGAVIVEPIQGRGGIIVPPEDFLMKLRQFCDRHGLVFIFDEIYVGFCRTGRWFACEHWGVTPDVVCVGKGMTGGFPMAACVGRTRVMDSWPESQGEAIHTSTFLGNPLGCVASLAAIAEMKRLKLANRATELNSYLTQALKHLGTLHSTVVRGKGLMLGLEVSDASRLCERLLQRGILALPEGSNDEVLGITPPLVITKRQLDYCVRVLGDLLSAR
jgi:4-aminobutyrate aminotransferase-like enzyme